MSLTRSLAHIPDPAVVLEPDGDELGRNPAADRLLGEHALRATLTDPSWQKLSAAVEVPRSGIEVVTEDGATWDVTVTGGATEVLVVLRDVTRYTAAAAKLTEVAHELAERHRDLQTLYEVSARLGSTLNLAELGESTSQLLCGYLGASHVETRVDDTVFAWPEQPPGRPADGTTSLYSPSRAESGRIAWWRAAPLDDNEQRLVNLIANRAAVGFDNARLLAETTHLADHDALTGLLNRDGGCRMLSTVAVPAALVLLDIDHFKRVNDEHGHQQGDEVLRRFAEVLRTARATDVVVRWGGEEFLLVLPATTSEAAVEPIDRLRLRVRDALHVGGEPVTFSAGVADLSDDAEFERALREADTAMYRAKRAGRDRVVRARSPITDQP